MRFWVDICIFAATWPQITGMGQGPMLQRLFCRAPHFRGMEMGHSVEGRVPFLDHHVVEVMRSQPVTQKIRGTTQKYVLRESARDVITETAYRRPKHPFLSPPATLNPQGRLSVLMQDMLRGPGLASMPFFNLKKIVNMLDGLQTTDENSRVANDQVLMMVLSACVLQGGFRLSA